MGDLNNKHPLAILATDVAMLDRKSNYPEQFRSRVEGRKRRVLGDLFALKNFGVNLTTLYPGAQSALMHRHSKQDEFIYVVEGSPTLLTDQGEVELCAGMCAGFPASGVAHHLVNNTDENVLYLEIGDRTPGDEGFYPMDDLRAKRDESGIIVYFHQDGRRY